MQWIPVADTILTSGYLRFSETVQGLSAGTSLLTVAGETAYSNGSNLILSNTTIGAAWFTSGGSRNFLAGPRTLLAITSGTDNTLIGNNAGGYLSSGSTNIIIGSNSGGGGTGLTTGSSNVIIASNTPGTGNYTGGVSVGDGAGPTGAYNYTLNLGFYSQATAANQAVLGGTSGGNGGIADLYIGDGVTKASPRATVTIHAGGGSGADNAGSGLAFAAGISTGAATPATLAFQTGTAAGSSSTPQTLSTHFAIGGGQVTTGIAPITITNSRMVSSQTTKPTATLTSTTLNDGGGSGATFTVANGSSDNVQQITITAGNGTPGAGVAGQVVFTGVAGGAPTAVVCTPTSAAAAARNLYISAQGATSYEVSFGVAAAASTAYTFNCVAW
jgi:hypothetical protein